MSQQHPTLSEAVDLYLASMRARRAPTTLKQTGYVLRRFVHGVGDIQVRHLRPEKVSAWFYGPGGLMEPHRTRDRRDRPPVTATTHNYIRSRLKSFFIFCTQRGYTRADLLAEVMPLKEVRRIRQQPPPHALLDMLDVAANGRDRAYLATLMNTGLRANEVLRLTYGDLDLEGQWLTVWISKSQQEDRLPITLDLDQEMRRWTRAYALDLGRPLTGSDHLFPASTGPRYDWVGEGEERHKVIAPARWMPGKPMTHAERVVQAALRALGLPTHGEGSHTVRRAVARHYFDSLVGDAQLGYDGALRTVSALLHHTNVSTTETYLGLSTEKTRRDKTLRGQPFLSAMVRSGKVLPLASHKSGSL